MKCKDDVNCYTSKFDDFLDNNCKLCLWLFNDSMIYFVDGSICLLFSA